MDPASKSQLSSDPFESSRLLRQRLAIAVTQAVARGDRRRSRTLAGSLAGKLLSLGRNRGGTLARGSGRRHYGVRGPLFIELNLS